MALNAEMQEMPSFSASSSENSCKNSATTDVLLYCLNFFQVYTVLNTFSIQDIWLPIQVPDSMAKWYFGKDICQL